MTSAEQRRLRRSAALHGFAVAVFAMLALSGAGIAAPRLYGLAVPLIITGLAGAAGAAAITAQVWRAQASTGIPPGTGVPGAAGIPGNTGLSGDAAVPGDAASAGSAASSGDAASSGSAAVPGAVATNERREPPQRAIRLAMAAAAVVALIAGVMLAPGGIDRGFVISVAALVAAALALFALLAGDRPRTAEPGTPH